VAETAARSSLLSVDPWLVAQNKIAPATKPWTTSRKGLSNLFQNFIARLGLHSASAHGEAAILGGSGGHYAAERKIAPHYLERCDSLFPQAESA
jgi:hypothetical protein